MTKSELRAFAKKKGISLSNARNIVKSTASEKVKDSRIFAEHKATVDPVFIDGPTVADQHNAGPKGSPVIIHTPGGLSNENWGIANIQIYGKEGDNNDEPLYSAETQICRSYVECTNIMAWGVQPGFRMVLDCLDTGHRLILVVLGNDDVMAGTREQMQGLVKLAGQNLPMKVQKHVMKYFIGRCHIFIDNDDFEVGSPRYVDLIT